MLFECEENGSNHSVHSLKGQNQYSRMNENNIWEAAELHWMVTVDFNCSGTVILPVIRYNWFICNQFKRQTYIINSHLLFLFQLYNSCIILFKIVKDSEFE